MAQMSSRGIQRAWPFYKRCAIIHGNEQKVSWRDQEPVVKVSS